VRYNRGPPVSARKTIHGLWMVGGADGRMRALPACLTQGCRRRRRKPEMLVRSPRPPHLSPSVMPRERVMRCNDCGKELTSKNAGTAKRSDVCDSCWNARTWLVSEGYKVLGMDLFRQIQREMASGRGTAKRLLDEFCFHESNPAMNPTPATQSEVLRKPE